MVQEVLRIEALPANPIDAAAAFYHQCLERAEMLLEAEADSLAIVLPSAPAEHDDWRRAIARDLARKFAPRRVNLLGGGIAGAVDTMLQYLGSAPGVTGQYLPLHD